MTAQPAEKAALSAPDALPVIKRAALRTDAVARNAPQIMMGLLRRLPRGTWHAWRDLFVGFGRCILWVYNWQHDADFRRRIDRMDDPTKKVDRLREVKKDSRRRAWGLLVLIGLAAIAQLVIWFGWSGQYRTGIAIQALALLVLFETVGRRKAIQDEPVLKKGALHHGVSIRALRRDIVEALEAKKIEALVTNLSVNQYGWSGSIHCEGVLDDKMVEHIERWVHGPPGSLLVSTAPNNSAEHPFSLLLIDPLDGLVTPADFTPGRDIRKPATLGRHLFGAPLLVNLMTHIGLVGRQRSGKSSGLWQIIAWIDSCANAKILGSIDLVGGPAFPVWRDKIPIRATTIPEAHAVLDRGLAIAKARVDKLGQAAESDDEGDITDNHQPTAAEPALYILVDELHAFSDDKDLMRKITLLARTTAKACVYLVLATQKSSKDDFGTSVLRAMLALKILFSCEPGDVVMMLGGGMIEAGWRPHRLKPAQGEVPYDAGKAFIWDGDHQTPEVVRLGRLTASDCRDRARGVSAPAFSAFEPETSQAATTLLPESLEVLSAAFSEYSEHDKLPSAWIMRIAVDHNAKWRVAGAGGLASALRIHHVEPRQLGRSPAWSGNPRGYLREDLARALQQYSAGR